MGRKAVAFAPAWVVFLIRVVMVMVNYFVYEYVRARGKKGIGAKLVCWGCAEKIWQPKFPRRERAEGCRSGVHPFSR